MKTTTMKRKRSDHFSPQPAATPFSTINHSPNPALYHDSPISDCAFHASYAHLPSPSPTPHSSPDKSLHSRTRKRFRDDRPDEQRIYETTYHKLFSAARQHSSPAPSHASPPLPQSQNTHHPAPQPRSQTSLNHFWHHLPAAPPSPETILPPALQTTCENCGSPVVAEGEDADMDGGQEEISCRECGRWVCGACVFEGGVGRVCGICADKGEDGREGMDLGGWLRRG